MRQTRSVGERKSPKPEEARQRFSPHSSELSEVRGPDRPETSSVAFPVARRNEGARLASRRRPLLPPRQGRQPRARAHAGASAPARLHSSPRTADSARTCEPPPALASRGQRSNKAATRVQRAQKARPPGRKTQCPRHPRSPNPEQEAIATRAARPTATTQPSGAAPTARRPPPEDSARPPTKRNWGHASRSRGRKTQTRLRARHPTRRCHYTLGVYIHLLEVSHACLEASHARALPEQLPNGTEASHARTRAPMQ